MTWLWQLKDWPKFTLDSAALTPFETEFLKGAGTLVGTWRHLTQEDQLDLRVEWLTEEAFETSAIEGEILNRDSVQSSVRRQFGIAVDRTSSNPAEAGIAEMMVDLYKSFDEPLTQDKLFGWHKMLMNGRRDIEAIGGWRTHAEAMQVVSGAIHDPKVHYEAPPSENMPDEMAAFIDWFNTEQELPALTRAGIAHLYFVCIHPFEDGNGRVGRAIAEKALAQSLGQPSLIALSQTISKNLKQYYEALQSHNRTLDITDWLIYFGQTIISAQRYSEQKLIRIIDKTKMLVSLKDELNARQEKALIRLFKAEPEGFEGGLSSENYRQITGTTIPTATRDLVDLVNKGALRKTGERRYTRYYLNLEPFE